MIIVRLLLAFLLGPLLALHAVAQTAYPDKPIRVVMPFPPGSAGEVDLRFISAKLGEALGQTVFVDPRSGAAGVIGIQAALAAPADGYTLLYIANQFFLQSLTVPNLRIDLLRDFTPLAVTAVNDQLLVVKSDSPYQSVEDLIAFGRNHPGKLTYGSAGVGSLTHLASSALTQLGNFEAVHLAMRGQPDAIRSLLAGETDFATMSIIFASPLIADKRLRPLATTGAARSPLFPAVPTLQEAVPPGFVCEGWAGLMAPAGVPPAVVDRLRRELALIIQKPEVQAFYKRINATTKTIAPAALADFYKSEEAKMIRYGRTANLKAE